MLHSNDNFKFWIIEVLPCIVVKIVCNPINSVDMIPLLPIYTKMVPFFFTSHPEKDILSLFSLLFLWKLLMTNIILIDLLVTAVSSLAIIFIRLLSWVFGFFLFLLTCLFHDLSLVAYFIDQPLFWYITWNVYILFYYLSLQKSDSIVILPFVPILKKDLGYTGEYNDKFRHLILGLYCVGVTSSNSYFGKKKNMFYHEWELSIVGVFTDLI